MKVASDRSVWPLLAILVLAAALRCWNLDHGLPFAPGVDEPRVLDPAIRMMKTGDFDPHLFIYPTLYTYVQLAIAVLHFLAGATAGQWAGLQDVGASDFYVWARASTALIGTATVLLVYLIGRRWDSTSALLAALLLAVMPMHVRESHYVLTDVPLAFFTTLTALLALRASEGGTLSAFALAGAAAGLAASTKYNGAVAVIMPILAAHMTPGSHGSWWKRDLVVVLAAGGAFLAGTPYALLSLPKFLDDYASLASHHQETALGREPAWLTFLKHLRLNFGWPALSLAGVGVVLTVWRAITGPARLGSMLVAVFTLLMFYLIAAKGALPYGRYLIPIVPFLCLMIAVAVRWAVSRLRDAPWSASVQSGITAIGVAAVLVPPALTAVQFDRGLSRPTTRAVAYAWIRSNILPGSSVAVEENALHLPTTQYRVRYVYRASDRSLAQYGKDNTRFLIASSIGDGFSFGTSRLDPDVARRDRELLDGMRLLVSIRPDKGTPGPEIRVFVLEP